MADKATDYRSLLQVCRNDGAAIHVVISGGLPGLQSLALAQLRPAALRYHEASDNQHSGDCVRGDLFRHICRSKQSEVAASSTAHGPQGRYFFATVSYHEMIRICRVQGDGVVVGVDGGGAKALRKLTTAQIVERDYKYDFSDRPLGSKDWSNWMSGTVFLEIVDQVGSG